MKPILEELKEHWEGWELSIKVRNQARLVAKDYVKQCEKQLTAAKRIHYQTTKAWREAKEEARKAKSKFKSFPSYKRSWAKKNMGKVIDRISSPNLKQEKQDD